MAKRPVCVVIGVDGGTPTVLEQYAREGALPNIADLLERGTFAEACLPAMPTITPTCWATIATGATPAVHGCTSATLHTPGRPLDEVHSAYWSERVRAEFVWEAAERAGRTALVVAYPTSWPPRLKRGYQIGGPGCTVAEYRTGESPPGSYLVDGVEWQFFTTDESTHELATRITLEPGADGDIEALLTPHPTHNSAPVDVLGWRARFVSEGRVRFCDVRTGAEIVELQAGTWSDPLRTTLTLAGTERSVTYRMKLIAASRGEQRLSVFVTPMADVTGRVSPAGLGARLNDIRGVPPHGRYGILMGRGTMDHETFLETERESFRWRTEATRVVREQADLDLVFHYSVMIDSINHIHRRTIEGYTDVDEATRLRSVELERGAYGIIDSFVGDLREMFGADAAIMLVSDHGSCGYSRQFRTTDVLRAAGLLVMRRTEAGEQIDWSASRAVPMHCSYISVNLEGRDPTGIVPPSQYEKTVDEIIAALYDAADPDTGKRMIALALRREDARVVGLGNPESADVVFAVAGGFGSPGGGVHAGQISTARSRQGTQCSLLLAAGPGIRCGHRIARTVRQHDIAPTISHLLGVPRPAQAEGAVISDMLS